MQLMNGALFLTTKFSSPKSFAALVVIIIAAVLLGSSKPLAVNLYFGNSYISFNNNIYITKIT